MITDKGMYRDRHYTSKCVVVVQYWNFTLTEHYIVQGMYRDRHKFIPTLFKDTQTLRQSDIVDYRAYFAAKKN